MPRRAGASSSASALGELPRRWRRARRLARCAVGVLARRPAGGSASARPSRPRARRGRRGDVPQPRPRPRSVAGALRPSVLGVVGAGGLPRRPRPGASRSRTSSSRRLLGRPWRRRAACSAASLAVGVGSAGRGGRPCAGGRRTRRPGSRPRRRARRRSRRPCRRGAPRGGRASSSRRLERGGAAALPGRRCAASRSPRTVEQPAAVRRAAGVGSASRRLAGAPGRSGGRAAVGERRSRSAASRRGHGAARSSLPSSATRASRAVAARRVARAPRRASRSSASRGSAAPGPVRRRARPRRSVASTSTQPELVGRDARRPRPRAARRRSRRRGGVAIRCAGATAAARRAASSRRASRARRRRRGAGPARRARRRRRARARARPARLERLAALRGGSRRLERRPRPASSAAAVARRAASSRRPLAQVSSAPAAAGAARSCMSQSSGSGASAASLTRLTRSATRSVGGLGPAAQREPAVAQPALDLLEPPGAEQLLEQPVPLLGPGPQERLEPALRQHRDLGELGEVHADQAGDQVAGLVEAAGQRHPGAVDALGDRAPRPAAVVVPVPRFLGRSQAGERTIRNRRPDSVASSVTRGAHARRRPGRSAAAWRRCGRRARRRTARSRRRRGRWSCRRRWRRTSRNSPASDRCVEVDGDGVGERAERGDLEVVQPHQATVPRGDAARRRRGPRSTRRRRRAAAPDSAVGGGRARACRRRSRGRCRGRSGPWRGRAGDRRAGRRRPARSRAPACAGSGARSRSIACTGRTSSVRVAWTQDVLVRRRGAGRRAASSSVAAEPGQRPRDRRVDELARRRRRRAPRSTSQRALAVVGLGEGVGQRRAAVADRVGQRVRGRAGGRGRRSRCRRRPTSAPIDTPPTLMSRSESLGSAAGDEGVGQHHRPGARRPRRPGRRGPGASPRSSAASCERPGEPPRLAAARRGRGRGCRDGDRAVLVLQQDRACRPTEASVRMKTPGGVDQPGAEAEPLGGVVVAAGQHDLGAGGGEPGQRLVGQPDGVDVGAARGRRRRPATTTRSTRSGLDHLEQVVDVRRLVRRACPPGGRTARGASRRCGGRSVPDA